jgi:U32 family peptidase
MKKSELLLPVGNYQMCLAAIHNGADAIYVGMPEFNARGRSHDHSWDELAEIIQTSHLYGIKVHLAFNILIFQDEIEKVMSVLDRAVKLGPDALIVQDIGLITLIKQRYPKLCIHGSTQMTVTNHESINLLADLDIDRFVLGRENSLSDIKEIKSNTNKELEVFVHGALCVAYSGQCFTSEALGGRSANRGQCAQSCRFDYELFVDGHKKQLLDKKYLLSPNDLCGIDEVTRLQELGVESFKVEGRLKSAEYVASTAAAYSKAINGHECSQEDFADMGSSFSRGFFTGWLGGVNHQALVSAKNSSNRGYEIGVITQVLKTAIKVQTNCDLAKGDGLLIVSVKDNTECGEKIYELSVKGSASTITLGPKIQLHKLKVQDKVYLTRRESVIKQTKQSMTNRDYMKRVPLEIKLTGEVGEKLSCYVSDGINEHVFKTESNLELAQKSGLTFDDYKKNLGGLSHSAYAISKIENEVVGDVYLHNRELKLIKKAFVIWFNEVRTTPKSIQQKYLKINDKVFAKAESSKLNILLRKKEQIDSILNIMTKNQDYMELINSIILDFEFGKDYFTSVRKIKELGLKCAIATTRILKPNEYHNFRLIERSEPDQVLVRNLGALKFFQAKGFELMGDFSLNCANSFTHEYLLSKGLSSQCLSYDLNRNQVNALIKNSDASKIEITLHQYMPEFHMEHCVFAAFMSTGSSFKDCGKPCEKHQVHLVDMYGNRHEIKADQECRNTMFKATAQSSIKYFSDWKAKGVGYFRFECLHEVGSKLEFKIKTYLALLSGEIDFEQAYQRVGTVESYGLTDGGLGKVKEYRSRKK